MNEMRRFIKRLETLSWNSPGEAIHVAAALMSDVSCEHIQSLLMAWSDVTLDRCAWESHETSTHFKWLLHRGSADAFQVWLHEYKPQSLLRTGYADSIHDHRYWFASKLMAGGFTQTTYHVSEHADETFDVQEIGKMSYDAGTIYIVDPDAVHTLSDFKHPTMTLLIRSRATKPFSTEIRASEGRVIHYYPLRTRIRLLRGESESGPEAK
jgi:hypothetical protein